MGESLTPLIVQALICILLVFAAVRMHVFRKRPAMLSVICIFCAYYGLSAIVQLLHAGLTAMALTGPAASMGFMAFAIASLSALFAVPLIRHKRASELATGLAIIAMFSGMLLTVVSA